VWVGAFDVDNNIWIVGEALLRCERKGWLDAADARLTLRVRVR
jgi:hypothetical protein